MAVDRNGLMDIKASFASASANPSNLFNMGLSTNAVPEKTDTVRQLDVTDFARNKNFHIDASAMPKASVQAAGVANVNADALRGQCQAVKADYLDTNAEIQNYATDVAKHCFGAKEGTHLMDQITPGGGPTHKQAFLTMADPSGTVGAIASAATAINSQMNRVMDQDVLAQLDEMLGKIQEASRAQHEQQIGVDVAADLPPPPPPGIEFDGITPQELLKFFDRNVEDDPVMQEIADIEVALDDFDRNMDYKVAHDHQVVTADKIAVASDDELLEMTGGDAVSAYAVEMTGLTEPAPMVLAAKAEYIDAQFATAHELKAGLADVVHTKTPTPAFNREADVQKLLTPDAVVV